MWKFITALLMSLVLTIEGFSFHTELDPENIEEKQAEVTDECLEYNKNMNCKFFECLEERFPCKSTYISKSNHGYCRRSIEKANGLNDVGKIWIEEIIKCFMSEMATIYIAESIDCNLIEEKVFKMQRGCFMANDFCEVGWDNRRALWKIFKAPNTEKQHYKSLWNSLGHISSKCTTKNAPELSKWIKSHESPDVEMEEEEMEEQ